MIDILLASIILLCSQGNRLVSGALSIDTELLLAEGDWQLLNYVHEGRPAIYVLKRLFGTIDYNPYLANVLSLFFIILTFVLIKYIISNEFGYGGDRCYVATIFSLLFSTSPILAEQLCFDLQCAEIGLGFLLSVLGAYSIYHYAIYKRGWMIVFGVLLCTFTFLIFQSFLPVILVTILMFLILDAFIKDRDVKKSWFIIIKSAILYIISFIIYQVILIAFCDRNDYLDGNIYWVEGNFIDNLRRLVKTLISIVLGDGIYYSYVLGILIIGLLYIGIRLITKNKNSIMSKVLLLLGILCGPFIMIFIYGGHSQSIRGETDMPFSIAILGITLYLLCKVLYGGSNKNQKVASILVSVVVVIMAWNQYNTTVRLEYADDRCYENDVYLAHEFGQEINCLIDDLGREYPVMIYGKYCYECNNAGIIGEAMGHSFFGWCDSPGWHNRRALDFMKAQGFEYIHLDEDICDNLYEKGYADDVPIWPHKGFVTLRDDVIIVRIGE